MRHLMTSFLALHWAVVFALLAFVCIGGIAGLESVLSTFGAARGQPALARLDGVLVAAPLACAFLVVAAVFCWALMETLLGEDSDSAEPILKLGFVAAGCVFALVLVVIGERLPHAPARHPPAQAAAMARAMATHAAHASLLSRISGRPDTGAKS